MNHKFFFNQLNACGILEVESDGVATEYFPVSPLKYKGKLLEAITVAEYEVILFTQECEEFVIYDNQFDPKDFE
jgi:hypothetical protein